MMNNKIGISCIILMFIISSVFFVPHGNYYKVSQVISPIEIQLENRKFVYNDFTTFDSKFTEHNAKLAKELNITKEEAFVLGNLGKYWATNLLSGRKVLIKDGQDLIYLKRGYRNKFLYSGFCIVDFKPYNKEAFEKRLEEIRRAKYKVYDVDTEIVYDLNEEKVSSLKNYILISKFQLLRLNRSRSHTFDLNDNDVKILFTDFTTQLKPTRQCSSSICKEILHNINNASETIDIAIYGYSIVPEIEEALKNAINRGVKIRLVYDIDAKGKNIYPDTSKIVSLLKNNKNDSASIEVGNIMHNKFYIFDNKILITGSANLSHTDMSGYNSNSIVVINSPRIANIYRIEFEQMFAGKFHSDKISNKNQVISLSNSNMDIYFSPQDKSITNAVLPLIRKAKRYVYIPTFVLTEKRLTEELIKAKQRGVDVKVIIDALNASTRHSKHDRLREGGVLVKTENYAGKIHSKSIIVDDEYIIIGSMNFSYSGENKNDENLVLIKNSLLAKSYRDFFLYQWNKIDDKWLKQNARAEGKDSIGSCFDGIDNNYDGFTDSKDVACQ